MTSGAWGAPGQEPLDLSVAKPLAEGSARRLYQHPVHEDVLIKIVRSDGSDIQRAGRRNRPSIRRYGALASWEREISEYVLILNKLGHLPDFVAPFLGFCQTSLGAGLMVGKIHDESGELAPTLEEAAARGIPRPALISAVDEFLEHLLVTGAVASDLRPRNLVVTTASTGAKLVLVDGLGDRVMFPLRHLSGYAHRRWVEKKRGELRGFLEQRVSSSEAIDES